MAPARSNLLCSCTSGLLRFAPYTGTSPFAGPRVCFGPLSANGQTLAMPEATKGSGIHKSLDIHRHFFSQIAFDPIVALDDFAHFDDLILADVFDTNGAINPRLLQNA